MVLYFIGFVISCGLFAWVGSKQSYHFDFSDTYDLGSFIILVFFAAIIWPLMLILSIPYVLAWIGIQCFKLVNKRDS